MTVGLRPEQVVPANTVFDALVYYQGTAPNDPTGTSTTIGNGLDTATEVNVGARNARLAAGH